MKKYYVITSNGPKGPYSEARVLEGLRQGKIPPSVRLQDDMTGKEITASELQSSASPQQPQTPTRRPVGTNQSSQYRPTNRPANQGPNYSPQGYASQQSGPFPQQGVHRPTAPNSAYPQQGQYGQQPAYPPQGNYPPQYGGAANPYGHQQPAGYAPYSAGKPKSALAIASLCFGIGGFVICQIFAPVAVILGIMALNETADDGPKTGRGFAIGGIVVGAVGCLLLLLVIVLIAADPGRL